MALEYRLDQSATRYVKVYYDRNYESLLEGELTEMGAGVVFRRKTDRLGELFIFRKKKQAEPPRTEKPDGPGPKDNGQQSTADEPQSTEKPDGPEPKTNSPEPTAAGPQSTETKDNSQQTTDNGEENIEEE